MKKIPAARKPVAKATVKVPKKETNVITFPTPTVCTGSEMGSQKVAVAYKTLPTSLQL